MAFFRWPQKKNIVEDRPAQPKPNGHSPKPGRRLSGYWWLIVLVGIVLIGSLWLYVFYHIDDDYDRTTAETSQETMNLAIAFEQHVRRVVADAAKDLSNLKQAYERDGIASPAFAAYAKTAAEDPSRNLVAVYNEQGIVVKSLIRDTVAMDRSYREYFLVHRDSASDGLEIGKPITGISSGRTSIPLTRRINKPDGSFGGIVYIGVRADYFLTFYQKIDLGPDKLISLSGMDGFVRTRQTGAGLESGQDVRGSDVWQRAKAGFIAGTQTTSCITDEINRIVSYRVMPDYPLIIAVGKSAQVALAGYEQRRQAYIFGAWLASLAILLFCRLLISGHEKTRKLTAAVRLEKDRLSSLIDSISDEVWFADSQHNFTLANLSALREFGLDTAEVAVEKLASNLEVLRPDGSLRPVEEAPPLRALRGEVVIDQQEIVRTPASGELRYREVSASPVRAADGNIIGSVAVVRDITERIALEKELERHRDNLQTLVAERTEELEKLNARLAEQAQILELAHDCIIVSGPDGKITYWNQGAEAGYGWLAGEAKGQAVHRLLKTQFPISREYVLDSLLTEGHWDGELTHTRKDGRQIIVHSHLTLNRDAAGDPVSILEINRDITAQKKYEAELSRLDRLNIIGELAAAIGHEVRNPMTTVRGYLQRLTDKAAFAEHRETFALMIEEMDRANSIISEFLGMAKNKTVKLRSTDLNTVIRSLFPLLQAEALRRGSNVELALADIPEVPADEKELRQCIINLVNNGLDAMPTGGKVTIATAKTGNRVAITVRDNGPGIPPAIKEKLGTPFLTTKENGTGLGLPVCYRIAQRHQAAIEVETGPAGTAFHFIFSLKKKAE